LTTFIVVGDSDSLNFVAAALSEVRVDREYELRGVDAID